MEIILPNNTPENPSVWDTNKSYEDQSDMAKELISKNNKILTKIVT